MKEKNCVSLDCGRYQKWKALAPQIFAVLLTASLHIFVGRYLTFGSLLAHQLEKEKVPKNVWLDNVPTCISLAGGVLAGVVVDVVGRLKTVKFSVVPGVLGSVLIATAQSVWILILGRALTTISFMLISTSTVVYISEISDSKLRGAFLSLVLVFVSFGTFVEHIEGSFLRFSIISWISIFYLVCPIVPLRYVHESPPWLVSKKRLDEAKLSCQWFNQFALLDEQKINTLAEFEVATLEDEQIELFENASYFASYFRSIFYKPFFSVLGVSLFQQLSGTIITVSHLSETYDVDSYYVVVYITSLKLLIATLSVYLMKQFSRRQLLLWITAAITLLLPVCSAYLQWLHNDTRKCYWIFLTFILIYFVLTSMASFIVYVISTEIFPLKIRGGAYGLVSVGISTVSFFVFEFYSTLNFFDSSPCHLYYLSFLFSILNIILIYVFVPETHDVKLSEVTRHFENNCTYFTATKRHYVST